MTRGAAATEPVAQRAVASILAEGGTATDAVVGGFLAAAGARGGVLLASVQILVVGSGVGPRAFDGRCRQPGHGARRPRGFREDQPVPPAGRVAVATSVGALALAHAYDGQLSFAQLAKAGEDEARAIGAHVRAEVIARVGQRGPSALHESFMARPLLAVAGAAEGGLLTGRDLSSARPASAAPAVHAFGARSVLLVPWATAEPGDRNYEVIAAADARGVVAALTYGPDDGGVPVPELELLAPREAVPVRRGVSRVTPGEALPAAAPFAILLAEGATLAFGVRTPRSIEGSDVAAWSADAVAPAGAVLAAARDGLSASSAVGVLVVRAEGRLQISALSPP